MHWSERTLIWSLRIFAVLLLTALIPIVMPYAWMNAIHRWLGMGELPQAPIVGYLTRSCSALYAYHGAVVGFLSLDIRRYLPVIRCLLWLAVVFGFILFGIDMAAGMPRYWIIGEGPLVLALTVALLWLVRKTEANLPR